MLGYEEALTRRDSLTGDWYDCSAHMLWIGERTRQLDGAHVEFLRGVRQPDRLQDRPDRHARRVLALCEALNPERVPGRLTLISRMGAAKRGRAAAAAPGGRPRRRAPGRVGLRPDARQHVHVPTRPQDPRLRRTSWPRSPASSPPTGQSGTWPGGVHVELTGDDVTECLGGGDALGHADLDDRYETICDPRLNGRQSIDLAFQVAELLDRR